jgi:predicted phage terminase large subunit-like protein
VPAATAQDEYVPYIYAPKSLDLDWYLGKLNSELMAYPQYRRKITRTDPLLFALMYMEHRLIDPTISRDIHLAQFHIDMAREAEIWLERNMEPGQVRQAWIAPRGAAKSSWICTILPIWALAHGHRRMVAAFAANKSAAERLMGNIRFCLDNYELLGDDFPDLCTPAMVGGKAVSDAKNMYVAKSGAVVMSYGIDSNQLGANIHGTRPDLILLDDIEDDEGNYSLHQKKQRLATVGSILPMNDRAVVQWAGTTTMYGSATHDLVRTLHGEQADWVGEYEFTPRHYRAIVTRPDGTEESIWPAKWSLERLRSIRHTRIFALQYDNMPQSHEDGLWTPETLPPILPKLRCTRAVLWIDPGVTTNAKSDPTGLAVLGASGARAHVLYADGHKLKPGERKTMVGRLCHDNPMIDTVYVEVTNGGDSYRAELEPVLPRGVKLVERRPTKSKPKRIEEHLDYCQMGWVSWAENHPLLREQMLAFPKNDHDDVLDAVCGAAEELLGGRLRAKVLPS